MYKQTNTGNESSLKRHSAAIVCVCYLRKVQHCLQHRNGVGRVLVKSCSHHLGTRNNIILNGIEGSLA